MIEKVSTGIEGLDQLTDGGFLRGSAYIIQGPPGAGKTILANQFCYTHVRAGGRALYMTLLAESSARMLAYVSQMSFYESSVVPGSLQYLSAYGVLEREGLPGLLKLVQHELKRHRATAMVLDGTFVAQSVASEQEFRAFIHALQGVAGMSDAVLVMLTHQNRSASCPEHTMVDGWIELSDETQGFRAYRTIQVRKHRGAAVLHGKHHFRITQDGIAVFPRPESLIRDLPAPVARTHRVGSGHAGLDALLGGGLPAGSATLLVGPSGAGKTTIGMHFLSLASEQEPALMLGFYETPAHLRYRARSLGLDLERPFQTGALEQVWLPPSENLADEVIQDIVQRARAMGARRVFVDGMVAIRDSLVVADRLPYVINALSIQLEQLGATMLYTTEIPELRLDETLMPTDELSAMVENILLVNTGRRGVNLHRSLSVVKLRDSDFDPRTHEFHIGDRGLMLGPDPRVGTRRDSN
ncbi:ATPase domain-containing protein [Fulvimonas yonginensis]|uniref:non-specific serine/threonine protein kinase n=1 Tax=Fulvimonas yonginensis TaxID=1495200 RepID=A0ABU8JCU2_9GAMM